jgi:hypothetical protein
LATIRPDPSAGDAFVRDATAGSANALLAIVERLGEESAHPELKGAIAALGRIRWRVEKGGNTRVCPGVVCWSSEADCARLTDIC